MIPSEFVVCYVDGKRYPRASCHRHHLDPRHAGGGDEEENLAWLSANAHQMVHRAAQLIKAGKKGHAQDLAMAAYPLPAPRQRFMEVVNQEVVASDRARASGTGKSEIIIEVPVPRDDYAKLKLLVSDKRVNGKKISIADYVSKMILSHLHKSVM